MQYGWSNGVTIQPSFPREDRTGLELWGRKDHIIHIGELKTFCIQGYKTSILRFLLDNSTYAFESSTDHLYLRGGDQLPTPAEAINEMVTAKAAAAAAGFSEVMHVAHLGLELAAKGAGKASSLVERPGAVASFVDRQFNKRLILTLTSLSAPKTSQYDSAHGDLTWERGESTMRGFAKTLGFDGLAGYIQKHF